MENLGRTFERFLMTYLSARSNLVIISQKKNLTSNRSKPIGVLTRTKTSCSDERLPIGYLLRNFQPNQSNFLNRFSSLQFNQEGKGVDTLGGLPPPQAPPGGDHANDSLTHPADGLQSKIKSFYTDEQMQIMHIFPADVLPRKYLRKISDRSFEAFVIFWSV